MTQMSIGYQAFHTTRKVMILAGGNDLRSKDLHRMMSTKDKDTFLHNAAQDLHDTIKHMLDNCDTKIGIVLPYPSTNMDEDNRQMLGSYARCGQQVQHIHHYPHQNHRHSEQSGTTRLHQ